MNSEQQRYGDSLSIHIEGPNFPLDKFQKALEHFSIMLTELDKKVSNENEPTIEWSITSVRSGSLHLTARGHVSSDEVDPNRVTDIVSTFAKGIQEINERPVFPSDFTNRALRSAKALTELIDVDDFAEIEFIAERWKYQVTPKISDHVDEITDTFHKSYGSVEGVLVNISVASTSKKTFGIRSPLQKKIITGYFSDELFEEAKNALGKRVYVFGLIRQRMHGDKKNIQVEELKLLPDQSKLMTVSEMLSILRSKN